MTKVQVSFDNGATWTDAEDLLMETKKPGAKVFSWTLWRHRISIEKAKQLAKDGVINVKVRAVASDGEMQMADVK